MTCIVGYTTGNGVYIGGDSAGSRGHHVRIRNDVKVFKKKDMIFGFTSSFRMGQLIRYKLEIPEHFACSDFEYMCTHFIDAVIDCFKENKYASTENDQISGGTFLVGYRGSLYQINSDFQVAIPAKNYDACGCGEQYALGALHTLSESVTFMSPEDIISTALDAANTFSGAVEKPFNIVKIEV